MKKTAVIAFYGTQQKVANALTDAGSKITQRGVSAWGDVVPLDRAVVLEKITAGEVPIEWGLYTKIPASVEMRPR